MDSNPDAVVVHFDYDARIDAAIRSRRDVARVMFHEAGERLCPAPFGLRSLHRGFPSPLVSRSWNSRRPCVQHTNGGFAAQRGRSR